MGAELDVRLSTPSYTLWNDEEKYEKCVMKTEANPPGSLYYQRLSYQNLYQRLKRQEKSYVVEPVCLRLHALFGKVAIPEDIVLEISGWLGDESHKRWGESDNLILRQMCTDGMHPRMMSLVLGRSESAVWDQIDYSLRSN